MNAKALQRIVELTQECLERYWQLDSEFVIGYFDKNVVWTGAVQRQYCRGCEAAAADLRRAEPELKPCHLMQQEFSVAQNSGAACTVVGRYLVTTDNEADGFLQVQQRCTFVWELVKGEPKIMHCHVSNPIGEMKLAENEMFPNALGKMSMKYWTRRLNAELDKRHIVVTDKIGTVHFLVPSEILYADAQGKTCIIHNAAGKTVHARMSITDFLAAVGDGFFNLHRSYVVNVAYIARIQKNEVILTNNVHIPIPARRYADIRDELIRLCDTETDKE